MTGISPIPDTHTSSMDIDTVSRATTGINPIPDTRTSSTDIDSVSRMTPRRGRCIHSAAASVRIQFQFGTSRRTNSSAAAAAAAAAAARIILIINLLLLLPSHSNFYLFVYISFLRRW